jgi:isopenicillin-N epimerase
MAARRKRLEQVESNPDRWFRSDYRPLLAAVRGRIAKYVGADPKDLVFVENASAGCNAFLRSFGRTLTAGSKVLYMNTIYGMVKNVLNLMVEQQRVNLVEVIFSAEDLGSEAAVLARVRAAVDKEGGAAAFSLAVVSHIASVPAVLLPLVGIINLLDGVPVFVDGAHAPGQIPLDFSELRAVHRNAAARATRAATGAGAATNKNRVAGAIAYTGNLHKWAYTPKGSAFLWASPEVQELIIPPVLSGSAHNFQVSFQ